MTDDRPLSSEEMIRRARQEMSRPPETPDFDAKESVDAPVDEKPQVERAPRQARPKLRRKEPLPPDPFTGSSSPRRQQAKAPAVAVLFAILVLGIGIALALVASTAP